MNRVASALSAALLYSATVLGCHNEDSQRGTPSASASAIANTKIVVSEAVDADVPECLIHFASDAFVSEHAVPAGNVRVEGDYIHAFAQVSVTRPDGTSWSGTFSGPRDSFLQLIKRHLCTTTHVYALKLGDNKDPTKGASVLTAYDMKPDEKADVDAFCHAMSHVPTDAGALDPDVRDHIAMQWVEDALTTTKWDAWRRSFARERSALFANKASPSDLFHARGAELAVAASTLGLTCPTATEWKKR